MRTVSVALLPLLAVAAIAQDQPAALPGVCRIHKLTLASTDLPTAERDRVVRAFQGGIFNVDELAERVRSKLRDRGYALVEVGAPQVTHVGPAQSACEANVRYAVRAGAQYRLGGISFTARPGDSVFSSDQLRAQFHLDDGAIFNASAIGNGLENLRQSYGAEGYANFGAIPKLQYDMAHHVVTVTIDIDQGRPASFGKLFMEGIEPRAGVAQELLASWKQLEGKRYDPQRAQEWLKRNSASWTPAAASQAHLTLMDSGSPSVMNVLLHFQ